MASSAGGHQLAPSSVAVPHQLPVQSYSKSCNISSILRITGSIGPSPVTFLLDSGAAVSVIRLSILNSQFRNQVIETGSTDPVGTNGSPLDVIGQVTLPVNVGNFQSDQVFIVVKTLTVDCLLGADYLVAHEVLIDYKRSAVTIQGNEIPFTLTNGTAITTNHGPHDRIITAVQTVTVPSRSFQLIDVTLPENVKSMNLTSVLIEPNSTAKVPQHIVLARAFSPVANGHLAVLHVMNVSPTPLTIHQGTKLG